ncbi:Uncharacterised protein [Klebsiella pneumoniae]|uniref:Uncharacterized protein n=1 Tax=Klebsiella pneumoniae TaxID=573 RepID=A0A378C881_KLEPN|nr:Uncharacterised protein [Klebsiella pneumoniae]
MSKQGIRALIISAIIGLFIWIALFSALGGIVSMNDFARKPARQQAVRLSPLSAFIRRVCYMLAQKGDPS